MSSKSETVDSEAVLQNIEVLWHINHFRSFNAKFFLYICIKWMISEHIFYITFLNKPELIFSYIQMVLLIFI